MSKLLLDPCNLVVVVGTLSAPPRRRSLPSGDELCEFDVTSRGPAGTASVPVSWFEPNAWSRTLDAGARVAIAGHVRRRFFRSGGPTQSRTEIVAARVVDATKAAAVSRLVAEAVKLLTAVPASSA